MWMILDMVILVVMGPSEITPHVDQLAVDGMRFTSYYSASRFARRLGSLLTGGYPGRVSFDAFKRRGRARCCFRSAEGLDPGELLLPEYLKWHRYATCHVGKWHLGDQPEHLPTRHGFDSYYGVPYSNDSDYARRPNSPPMRCCKRGARSNRTGSFDSKLY